MERATFQIDFPDSSLSSHRETLDSMPRSSNERNDKFGNENRDPLHIPNGFNAPLSIPALACAALPS